MLKMLKRYVVRHMLWFKQRHTRGFDDRELWSLDLTIAKFLVPRLEAFMEKRAGHPTGMTDKKWKQMLNLMIEGFRATIGEDYIDSNPDMSKAEINKKLKANSKKQEVGLQLFTKHFKDLWD